MQPARWIKNLYYRTGCALSQRCRNGSLLRERPGSRGIDPNMIDLSPARATPSQLGGLGLLRYHHIRRRKRTVAGVIPSDSAGHIAPG